jgi:toxin CptA
MVGTSWLVALLAVAAIGFANQRGGTCTVAAMSEIVTEGRFGQMAAMMEASIWVAGGLLLLSVLGHSPSVSPGYAASSATIAGGVLFGIGAFLNRACSLGTIARIGSGDWAYLATLAGFYLGAWSTHDLPAPGQLTQASLLLGTPVWLAIFVLALMAARVFTHGWRMRRGGRVALRHVWSPHLATTVIGIAFLVALVTAGSWSYTSFLGDLARGSWHDLKLKLALNLALLSGAIIGGWTANRLGFVLPDRKRIARCLAGGTIMGAGATLIPGGNTRLILMGMPLLHAYAWLAFASMCITLYALIRLTRA